MFTGIINGVAKVVLVKKLIHCWRISVCFPLELLIGLKLGDSVSNNGCCLTVSKINKNYVVFDIINESLSITNFKHVKVNDYINIERSVKFGDEIGGHLVSGHVITTAKICKILNMDLSKKIILTLHNQFFKKYLFYKGFVSIDGISLTVGEVENNFFCVNLIPETIYRTNIQKKKIGDIVNIEFDYYTQIIVDSVTRYFKQFDHKI